MNNWFYYFTQPSKLEADFDRLADSEKLKLLREFLYESDQCDKKLESSKKLNNESNIISNGNAANLPLIMTIGSPVGSPMGSPLLNNEILNNNFPLDFGRDNCIQQMKKSQILSILALKCFANLRFNINIIHNWGMPLCLVGNLLRTFIRFTTGVPTVNPSHDVDWPGWTGVSRFAQVVYHFWTLLEGLDRVLIKSHKRCLTPPLPGLTEVPDIVFINENNLEESDIVSRLEQSAQILSIMLERSDLIFEIPSSQSFKVPDLESDGLDSLNFEDRTQLNPESINSNIMFFLGRHCFQRKDFERALNFFKNSKICLDSTFNHLYFMGLTAKLLDSYISLCIKLSRNNSLRFRSPYQFIEDQLLSKDWNIETLTSVLMNDLYRRFDCNVVHILNSTISNKDICPLTLSIREQLEHELKASTQNGADKMKFFKVSVCNLLERVISGHAILTNFISDLTESVDLGQIKDVLKYLNDQVTTCLEFFRNLKIETNKPDGELKRSSSCPNIFSEEIVSKNDFNLEIENIKCFVEFLLHSLPREFGFASIVCQGELMEHYTADEIEEMKSFMNDDEINLDDLEIYDLEDIDCDWFSMHERKPLAGDNDSDKSFNLAANINPNDVDTLRLLTSYDCEEVKDILLRLQTNGVVNHNTVVNISDNWKLPSVILDEMKNIKNEFEYVYAYTILCKANVLRDLKSWDLARFLYDTIKNSTTNHKFKKLINNEITCNDIQKCLFTYQDINPNKFSDEGHADLEKRVKSCLTSAKIDSDSWITDNLMISCCCFCLSVKDYDYLLSIPNSVSTTVELSTLIITVYKDFEKLNPSTKFVKSTKDLFEFLLKVVVPTKKPGIYNCMSLSQLRLFIELLGNCSLLDLLISGLVSILTCLRSDINLSRPLFPKDIWPTTISSNFNTAIDTTHLDDLVLFAIDKAISQNPHNYNWIFVKADLALSESDFFKAMRNYLEAGAAATEFFTKVITKDIYTDWVLQQMIRCCREMGFHHQAIFLCQYIPEINIAAQMATQITVSNDSSDLYIHLMWDINLIEILAAIEYERGALSRHKRFLDCLSQPDLNSNNNPEIISCIQERKKLEFLRLISMQYVMR